ncbi:hypothetical protein KJ652_01925 [Patescibacteria group bacterium]|nr:hypothetical protein [Patescibacteria group bacterium]MBU1123323.1 hypothetical protein [Patescibacteria group bacterium]MBU1911488.1 hypothetical protein [Patescibacteria group bacterium]
MIKEPQDITNAVLLEHIQGIKYDLTQQITGLSQKMDKMGKRLDGVENRLDNVEDGLDKVNIALQKLYERRIETNERIDHIEEIELPTIKKHVGMTV